MKPIERHRLMPPDEREKWDRWRKRGRRRFQLMVGGVIMACMLLFSAVIAFVPGFGLMYTFMILVGTMLGVIPLAGIFGNLIWNDMERRYEASRDFFPTEDEQRESEADIRANLVVLVPMLGMGLAGVLLPDTGVSLLCLFSTPFFVSNCLPTRRIWSW